MQCSTTYVWASRSACETWALRHILSPPGRCTPTETVAFIYLDKHMLCGVNQESGICVRNHCGAEPPRDIEPPGLVPTVGGRDRASASYAAADRVKAPARAARGRFRGIHGGRTAPSLPAEAGTVSGGGCLAGSVPPVLVRSRGCSRTPPRPHGSVNTNEKEDKEKTTRPKPRTWQRRNEMKIKVTSVYVDDQDKALRFYTQVLGFAKKADFSQGPYRWLTVASPEEPDGTELQLALNNNPAAKAYQQAIFQQGQPAAMFYTDDVKGDYERIKARGAEFTMPPTDVTASTIAMLNDTCGNLIQLTQLARY